MTAPQPATAAGGDPGRPAARSAYWARVQAIAAAAPPLTDEQRAEIRGLLHPADHRRAAA